jgi:predicted alpha/beta-hydrolase family hydrolase
VTHLLQVKLPVLIVQGTKDSFGGPEDLRRALEFGGGTPLITIHAIEGGDHSLTVRAGKRTNRTQETVDQEVLDRVTAWMDEQSGARA